MVVKQRRLRLREQSLIYPSPCCLSLLTPATERLPRHSLLPVAAIMADMEVPTITAITVRLLVNHAS